LQAQNGGDFPMDVEEYFEGVAAEMYKREVDADEAVIRSLPFFATALGLVISAIGIFFSKLTIIRFDVWGVLVDVMCVAIIIFMYITIIFLYLTVKPRAFAFLPSEVILRRGLIDLKEYYQSASNTGIISMTADEIDKAAIRDFREEIMIDTYANASAIVRGSNVIRVKARAVALKYLIFQWVLFFVINCYPDGG
jgi:hypothetical protein